MTVLSSLSCRTPIWHRLTQFPPASPHGSSLFVYSIQMTRLPAYILLLALFLLAACNSDKNEFMTPKPDVNVDEYSLNGTVLGKTATDISAIDIDSLRVLPLESELMRIWSAEREKSLKNNQPADEFDIAKLHVDDNLSFGDFYKTFTTMYFAGYTNIKYVIGSDFKNVYNLKLPTKSSMCFCSVDSPMLPFLRYKHMRHRQKLSFNEILALREGGTLILGCFEDYNDLDLLLSFYREDKEIVYVLSLNEDALKENGSFHEFKFYSFTKEADLWKFLGEICSKAEMQNKKKSARCSSDLLGNQVALVFEKDVLMKDIAPLIKGLKALGYDDRINFMEVH